jgi:hypothetical protein
MRRTRYPLCAFAVVAFALTGCGGDDVEVSSDPEAQAAAIEPGTMPEKAMPEKAMPEKAMPEKATSEKATSDTGEQPHADTPSRAIDIEDVKLDVRTLPELEARIAELKGQIVMVDLWALW